MQLCLVLVAHAFVAVDVLFKRTKLFFVRLKELLQHYLRAVTVYGYQFQVIGF